jgi:hypothetical protein
LTGSYRVAIDHDPGSADNIDMSIDSSKVAELHEAAERAASGVRDAETARRARNRMDENRKEVRKRVGEVALAVPFVRELRDE